jgi:hypothetical protein
LLPSQGAALFRATKDCGKLVDPFSPNKSIQYANPFVIVVVVLMC